MLAPATVLDRHAHAPGAADDATAAPVLRLLRAPITDPPYDDERTGPPQATGHDPALLPLPLPLPLQLPRSAALRRPPPGEAVADKPAPAIGGDPRPRALALVRALLEVLGGSRPLRHLAPVTAPGVMASLERTLGRPRTSRRPVVHRSLRSLRVATPAPGVAEVSAVLQRGERCVALAMRIVALDDRWVITDLTLG